MERDVKRQGQDGIGGSRDKRWNQGRKREWKVQREKGEGKGNELNKRNWVVKIEINKKGGREMGQGGKVRG